MVGLILIVEDDSKTLKLLRDIMQIHGYEVSEATDGQQAVESAVRESPDLIIMDLQLPVMNGLEATQAIKSNPALKNIPVIALTAFAMRGQDEKAFKCGCDAFISKPFDIDVLLSKIQKYTTGT